MSYLCIHHRAMLSICHSNVTTVRDCSSTRGQEIDIPNCIRATDGIVVHTVRPLFHEGKFVPPHQISAAARRSFDEIGIQMCCDRLLTKSIVVIILYVSTRLNSGKFNNFTRAVHIKNFIPESHI